jgi:two-component sensor histidine kinase
MAFSPARRVWSRLMRPFGPPLLTRQWPVWSRYVVTTLLIGLILGFSQLWTEAAGHVFWLFLTVIIICAALFDRGTSLYATALSGAVIGYSAWTGDESLIGPSDIVAGIFFILVGIVTGGLIELLHRTVFRLNETNDALLAAEREKDLLLKESAHRVRNDLSRLLAIVELERRAAEHPDVKETLQAIADRIRVFSRLQNRLLRSGDEAVVQMREYISDLCQDVHSSVAGLKPVSVAAHADPHPVGEPTAIVVGLIINELVTNALKHAFPDNHSGTVSVTFRSRDGECVLCVEDDGVGIPPEASRKETLGQRLISSLVSQLQGSYEIRRRNDGPGTFARVRFRATQGAE